MNTDYQKLCVELFGTDNIDELRQIAQTLKVKNTRNAGRKKKFRPEDVQNMQDLIARGVTVNEVAERYGTSRQIVSKYIHMTSKPAEGYTLRMTYMYQTHPCTIIDVDFLNQKVMIQNRTKDMLHRAFGIIENPTWNDFEMFLNDRCFPATRGNAKEILKELQLTSYDPLQIVEKTRGRTAEDDMWLKFNYYPMEGAAYGHNQS
ncbi:MAG: helix-turn-helix domain-containing protein [Oscillospiraceae bacterium]